MRVAAIAFVFSTLFSVGHLRADDAPRDPQITVDQPGVSLTLVAEHPDLVTPTGIDVDDDGQIWVVATHTHFRPDDYVGPEHDEVLVFADRDGDGRAEDRRVFYNQTDATMDLELGPDGWVYLAERDRILRIKDSDGDGKADLVENIAVLVTEADYPHNGLEGLAWHPNGDLIFAIGENFAKPWTLTGTDQASVSGTGEGGIFRCTPDGTNLRRFARGFWNPFGICVRDDGEIFAAENDPGERPPCRLLHIVEAGDYGYQRNYGAEAHHPFVGWNGELRGTLPMIHPSGEAPCGVQPLGRGLLVPSWSDHRIDFFLLHRKGASFAADRIKLLHGSRYFRPSCIASVVGGEGGDNPTRTWYLCDWVDGRYQAHGYGRLWKLDIDLALASWTGPMEPEPLTENGLLARDLVRPESHIERARLLQLAKEDDPFLVHAALEALAKDAASWKQDEIRTWPTADRVLAVLALRRTDRSSVDWTNGLLSDESADVQFEALRWIADAGLTALRPEVEKFLGRSDLDYKCFEAAIATLNTLDGKPDAGIRNPEMLLARVNDTNSSPRLRAFALRLLPIQPRVASDFDNQPELRFPKGLTIELLKQLLELGDETLAMEVVRTLSGSARISQAVLQRVALDRSQSESLRAEAAAGLASIADDQIDLLLRLATDDSAQVREESIRNLRGAVLTPQQSGELTRVAEQFPGSSDLVQAVLDPKSLSASRPKVTDTDAWLAAIEAISIPANPDAGRRLFHHAKVSQCSNCHRHGGRGNVVGPDLSGLSASMKLDKSIADVSQGGDGRRNRRWLLQSILEPSRQMAPEYQPRTILLKDGEVFTGIRLRSSTKEAMRDSKGQNRTFDRDEIESMVDSDVSFMPTGLVDSLTIREVRDLLAFLESGGD
ncbi:MAG: hypothetical protein KDB00_07540 [Planctomycetales bacterium]|nr:hypothetical protein [Planctomycetales bacterium]